MSVWCTLNRRGSGICWTRENGGPAKQLLWQCCWHGFENPILYPLITGGTATICPFLKCNTLRRFKNKLENINLEAACPWHWLWHTHGWNSAAAADGTKKVKFRLRKTKSDSGLNKAVTDLLTRFTWSVKVHWRYPKLPLMGPAAAAHWRVNVRVKRWMKSLCQTLWVTARRREVLPACTPFTVHSFSNEIWMAGLNTVARAGNDTTLRSYLGRGLTWSLWTS